MTLHEDGEPSVRGRGYLPHWEQLGANYFVTFRLADALPLSVAERLRADPQALELRVAQGKEALALVEQVRVNRVSAQRTQVALDSGFGACLLARPEVADLIARALGHFDGARYRLICWCIMPNHVHVVVQPLGDHQLAQIVHSWKSFTANQANPLLGRHGDFWQREYYDHLVRDEADLVRIVKYVVGNPVKANLADWSWVYLCSPDRWADKLAGATGAGWKPALREPAS